ncbi:type I signal peptidase, putative [Plasmodium malariae]|uniref:Type I signal peptidase, putative n=1 Tax=Plasmodium malariae TaxID=5858 RepID=A0A1C3L2D8_PLAMA|nr:type I signal peptidase, putative [Plasmodium malariae]
MYRGIIIHIYTFFAYHFVLTTYCISHNQRSSMQFVELHIILDYALRFFHELRNMYSCSCINILHKCHSIINLNVDHTYFININNRIHRKIENHKRNIEARKNIYKRGDVVLLISPVNNKKRVCKRIIAIESDKLFVDNFKYFLEIPKDNIWVEGDNKMDSFDSRNYGCVHVNLIIGRVFFLLDPFKKFCYINNKKNYIIEKNRFLYLSN